MALTTHGHGPIRYGIVEGSSIHEYDLFKLLLLLSLFMNIILFKRGAAVMTPALHHVLRWEISAP
jgi:hypothetical protein